jgi:hypothetical protein
MISRSSQASIETAQHGQPCLSPRVIIIFPLRVHRFITQSLIPVPEFSAQRKNKARGFQFSDPPSCPSQGHSNQISKCRRLQQPRGGRLHTPPYDWAVVGLTYAFLFLFSSHLQPLSPFLFFPSPLLISSLLRFQSPVPKCTHPNPE